ncbi:MAG: long-chain-fatty-acyl-CoA reductase, partial [Novosphingobium sp.]|nr:long-chain-fatty-acyl-CoA reductase [Novosphingobium sp.]
MNELSNVNATQEPVDSAPFFVRGKVIEGADSIQRSRDLGVTFATPGLPLDELVHPRTELPPLLNTPLAEIIDFLHEAGQKLCDGRNPYVEACIDRMAKVSLAPRSVVAFQMTNAAEYLDRKVLWEVVEQNFPNPRVLDEWVPHNDHQGRR